MRCTTCILLQMHCFPFGLSLHYLLYFCPELSEYVIQQDEEGEALVATICTLKQQLAGAKEEISKIESERTTVVPNGPTLTSTVVEENDKVVVGTIQRSQE